jgi:hypothetical protein
MKLPEIPDMNAEQRRDLICQMKVINTKKARQCEHIKTNGEFCGSPAMRGRNYCYFHLTYIGRRLRAERVHAKAMANAVNASVVPLELPPLEDANSVQMALMQVIDAILHNRLDTKRAGLVLYALQTASSNLARTDLRQQNGATVAAGYEEFEKDFELGDVAPELQVPADEAEETNAHAARIAEIEEMATAYAKVDAAEATAESNRAPADTEGEEEEDLSRLSYPCSRLSQFFCRMNGPLAQKKPDAADSARCVEREALSQKLEIVPVLRTVLKEAA